MSPISALLLLLSLRFLWHSAQAVRRQPKKMVSPPNPSSILLEPKNIAQSFGDEAVPLHHCLDRSYMLKMSVSFVSSSASIPSHPEQLKDTFLEKAGHLFSSFHYVWPLILTLQS